MQSGFTLMDITDFISICSLHDIYYYIIYKYLLRIYYSLDSFYMSYPLAVALILSAGGRVIGA